MAQVHVPRSLAALFPGVPRRLEVEADDLAGLLRALDARYPGMWDRLCVPGPRLREHINAFVDGRPASLDTPLAADSVVHIIPAVSGGAPVSLPSQRSRDQDTPVLLRRPPSFIVRREPAGQPIRSAE